MANTKSAKKAQRASLSKKAVNNSRKNRIRSFIKKVVDDVKLGNKEQAVVSFRNLESEIMKGVTKKIFKLNTAARKLSRIYGSIKKLSAK
jgi:small subunit ribosomal protein S20